MDLSERRVLLWIRPVAASLLLGSTAVRRKSSRWLLRGVLDEDPESSHGLWTRIQALEERGAGRNSRYLLCSWSIRPKLHLVRWDWIQIFQVFDSDEHEGQIGFRRAV